jgi:hypothetical protein
MPINTDLNTAPYFDDFDIANQYHKILFKPGYAVQARELTQLQTILQSQIEQFGDNIFKEGSIVKGCNFTTLGDLQFVKVINDIIPASPGDPTDILSYVSKRVVEQVVGGNDIEVDYVYEIVGTTSGLRASILSSARGFESRPPDLNTFYINYLTTNEDNNYKVFQGGEALTINLYKFKVGTTETAFPPELGKATTSVTLFNNPTGHAYGIQSSPGIVFQKGHFLFAEEQTLVVAKYSNLPDSVAVGYTVQERLTSALTDNSLYDNANGSNNENAPGADRLKLQPLLTVLSTGAADSDPTFFALIRYQNGNEIALRDVSQYNVLGEELAKRTFEESGNYILNDFKIKTDRRDSVVKALVGTGTAYVKGFRVENTGERSYTIDQITGTEIHNSQPVSFNYGSYVDVVSYNGQFDIDVPTPVPLLNANTVQIGTTYVSNLTPTKLFLHGTRFDVGERFANVAKIDGPYGEVTVGNILKDTSKSALIFNTGMFSVKETTDTILPVRVQESITPNSAAFTISASPGDDFNVDNTDLVVISNTNTFIPITSVSTTSNSSILNVQLNSSITSGTIYYNKRIQGAVPHTKEVKTPFVGVPYTTAVTKYSLGFPDVFRIVSIVDPSNNDFTDSFRLKSNQKNQYYDLSYMEYIQGRPKPSSGVQLTVGVRVFELSTVTGEYFFTVNSYPNTLDQSDIPIYDSGNKTRYNLRESFDFRPYVDIDPAANYNALVSAPSVITNTVDSIPPTFVNNGIGLIPALNTSATTDIESYLSRIDLITVDSYGEINLVKGKEDSFAVPPKTSSDKLAIAQIKVPGFPALSAQEAAESGKREYAIKAKSIGTKNYTMKDIKSLERKVDDLVYYISLSQLETDTQNLSILDENGLSRFKNGFLVDPFNDLSLANVENTKFDAAVPFNKKILMPSVKTFPLDLKYKSSTGAAVFPSPSNIKVATVARDETTADVTILSQYFASEFRNCVSNFYSYNGSGVVSPPYDAAYDTTTNPLNLEIDLITPFQDFVDNLQEFVPLTDSSARTEFVGDGNRFSGIETTTTSNRQLTFTEQTGENSVGEFVTNFQFNPYMESRDIKVYMSGLRPDTNHYFFFDEVPVANFIIPGSHVDAADDIERFGQFGDIVKTDEFGVLRAVFNIPSATFFVGDRVLQIADVDDYNSIDSGSTSRGIVTYRAYNFSVEKASLTTSTRAPDFDIATTTTTRNLPRRPITGRDPLAQTFFVKSGMGKGSNSVFLSKVDLFFKRVSTVNGVTVMIREVLNGYPTNQTIPFSRVHYKHNQVNVSDDASAATTFNFDAPVRLDVDKEYCIVVMPDANDPNYLIFTSKVGGVDLTPGPTQGQSIVQDWGDGVLFTSTNDRAWKSYQDEDVKFNLYRHNFAPGDATITLTHSDHEFLSVDDITGKFNVGELIYQEKGSNTNVGISIAGGAVITGGSTVIGDVYNAGDYILLTNGALTRKDIFKILSIDAGLNTAVVNKPSSFNGVFGAPVVVGRLSYYNTRNPNEMHLDNSSARSNRLFSSSSIIKGLDSGFNANLVSVDDINISYVQPMIMKANDSVSTISMSGTFVSPKDVNVTYNKEMKFNDNNHFNNNGVVVYSKSNDVNGTKSFDINIDISNDQNVTSTGVVDIEISKLIAYQYKITSSPDTTSSYISKTIELAEDLDAEDLNLIITGYRPNGTDIKTYIRPQNEFDSDNFDSVEWIELELFEGVGTYSSTTNINDYREFKYRVASANKDVNGAITYTSNAGDFSGYRKFAIRIDMLSDNIHSVPTLKDYRGIALT